MHWNRFAVGPCGSRTSVSGFPMNALSGTVFRLEGMTIFSNRLFPKARSPIAAKPSGRCTEVSSLKPKACSPISFTPAGSSNLVNLLSNKAVFQMNSKLSGKVIS